MIKTYKVAEKMIRGDENKWGKEILLDKIRDGPIYVSDTVRILEMIDGALDPLIFFEMIRNDVLLETSEFYFRGKSRPKCSFCRKGIDGKICTVENTTLLKDIVLEKLPDFDMKPFSSIISYAVSVNRLCLHPACYGEVKSSFIHEGVLPLYDRLNKVIQ